jgi:hypothetical protein
MTKHVRLPVYDSIDLDRLSYALGDLVVDLTNNTLRLMNGVNQGGTSMATQPWVNQAVSTPLLSPQSVAPHAVAGQMAVSDGQGWDPIDDGLQHLMIYLNDSWTKVV